MKITTIQAPTPPITEVNISLTPVEAQRLAVVLQCSTVQYGTNKQLRDVLLAQFRILGIYV